MAKPERTQSVTRETPDLVVERLRELEGLVPEAFTEGKVDFDRLRAALGDFVDDSPERYSFSWSGKRDAIRLLQTPSRATLVPAKDESVNPDLSGDLFIEGDNLEVLKLLYKSYFGRVKMIYIDPPYNTGNDFVYPDNYADPLDTYLQISGQKDAAGNLLTSNPETSGRYHSAWLSMVYPRLFLARQLLREDGVIFVSIDDNEVHNLRMLVNEVFGEENFVATVIWQKMYAPKSTAKHFSEDHDYVVVYAREGNSWRADLLPRTEEQDSVYKNPDNDPRGLWRPNNLAARNYYSKGTYSIKCPSGRVIPGPPRGSYWRVSEEKLWALHDDGRVWWGQEGNNVPAPKIYMSEVKQGRVPQTLWLFRDVGHSQEAKKELVALMDFEDSASVFETPKPVRLMKRMLQVSTQPDTADIVLDFFGGSCTTAQAVLELNREDGGNRRFIMVQLPEPTGNPQFPTIADIGKERIRRVIAKMQKVNEDKLLTERETPEDLGFKVYKLAESNYRNWKGVADLEPERYAEQMAMFDDPLADGWTVENVIYEVAIKEGFGLNCQIERSKAVKGNTVYQVTDPDREQRFCICLDDALDLTRLKPLNLTRDDLFICRDKALDD
ncbi:MAG: site-specific DNA-methyltransferase, partial [Armatimonadetes bacterium]|nr:site-specific DNA-methyltransferase [Armatimonadota bacterium]